MFLLIGIVLIGVGILFIVLAQRTRTRSSAAAQWPTAPGRIIESRVVESQEWNSETDRYEKRLNARIVYEYQVGQMVYRADRFAIGSSVGSAAAAVQQHPVGRPMNIHFNPQNPGDAALYVRQSQGCMFIVFAVAFLGMGLICTLVGLVELRAH